MKEELDNELCRRFPLIYRDRHAPMNETCMCWGFSCGDGWHDIIYKLSEQLETMTREYYKADPERKCSRCGCERRRHYACKTQRPGACLAIHYDTDQLVRLELRDEPKSLWLPELNRCGCEAYDPTIPKVVQVKEKFGGLRYYMDNMLPGMAELITEAERQSYLTCEDCGAPGKCREGGWIRTLCNACNKARKK